MTANADLRPPIDEQWLARMRTTKPDFLSRLFGVYLVEEPKRYSALAQAVSKADLEQARFLAHSMKGAAATMGMERLRDACRELEFAAKDGESRSLQTRLETIGEELDAVLTVMRGVVNQEDGLSAQTRF